MKKAKAYILEFLVIFLSISFAFLSENWRENIQDKEDYGLILDEIHANLLLDSIEFARDISSISGQINAIDRILDTENPCPTDSIEYYFGQLMYHFRWPDVKSTGIGQLRNSKTIDPDSELISEVNNYYTWTEYLKESTPYQYILPQNDFNEWIVQNELVTVNINLPHTDPGKYRHLVIRLQHLKRTKELQRGVYRTGLTRIVDLLEIFESVEE
jgi:hypothetical protein